MYCKVVLHTLTRGRRFIVKLVQIRAFIAWYAPTVPLLAEHAGACTFKGHAAFPIDLKGLCGKTICF